ncbi:MAG: exodeoxyribonuclease V subunit beta [Gammaproteobacteria bacterium]|nr:exodeoxyribonuclease V subunit beta [Gammaproteobacteria bacterium]
MQKTNVFSILETPLQGNNLIEASAGTGKTYAISYLFLRFLLQTDADISAIPVVTFTTAATEELQTRILTLLQIAQKAFATGQSSDATLQQLIDQSENRLRDEKKIAHAINCFDQASISTIHGFCQRLLRECPLQLTSGFNAELLSDVSPVLKDSANQFWRRHSHQFHPLFAEYLMLKNVTPQKLIANMPPFLNKPFIQFFDSDTSSIIDFAALAANIHSCYQKIKTSWFEQREEIVEFLLHSKSINRNKYKKPTVTLGIANLEEYLTRSLFSIELPKFCLKLTNTALHEALNAKQSLIEFDLWHLMEEYVELNEQIHAVCRSELVLLSKQLFLYLEQDLSDFCLENNISTFDSLQSDLYAALQNQAASSLKHLVTSRYKTVLVDEFQDTDPIQYEILETLFLNNDMPSFLIGDPKQAIYGFRGGDIFTYLQATLTIEHLWVLETNWRSASDLVEFCNFAFSAENAFVIPQIKFFHSKASGAHDASFVANDDLKAFNFFYAPIKEKSYNKEDLNDLIIQNVVAEVLQLLNHSEQYSINDRSLRSDDISILVNTNRQADLINRALAQHGVASALIGRQNIFQSEENRIMEFLLTVIVYPERKRYLANLFASRLFNFDAQTISEILCDTDRLNNTIEFFMQQRASWYDLGLYTILQNTVYYFDLYPGLLKIQNGIRSLSNLFHLAELIQKDMGFHSPDDVILFLQKQRQENNLQSDEAQIRLANENNLVQIATIHKSKGLEYSVCFCPFLWEPVKKFPDSRKPLSISSVHQNSQAQWQTVLAFHQHELAQVAELKLNEELSERMRLFYVALTRAKYRCYVYAGQVSNYENSALGWFFSQQLGFSADKLKDIGQNLQAIYEANATLNKTWSYAEMESAPMNKTEFKQSRQIIEDARKIIRQPRTSWVVGSYTSILHRAEKHPNDMRFDDDNEAAENTNVQQQKQSMPRGAEIGLFFHEILEHINFTASNENQYETLIRQLMAKYAISELWFDEVLATINQSLNTCFSNEYHFCLAQLQASQCVKEMEFNLKTKRFNLTQVIAIILKSETDLPFHIKQSLEQLGSYSLNGFLKGFIDLIFEHEGKYYIADYKSNYLGDGDHAYHAQAIIDDVAKHQYLMQMIIYTLALHQYLKQSLNNYSFEQHFGGVFYLYLRGMKPDVVGSGVFSYRPRQQLITELSCHMAGEEV